MVPEQPAARVTRQRALVLRAVERSGVAHPSAERIFREVRQALPRVSLGTVYRNLQRLADEGRIGVVRLDGQPTRYDPTATPHDHFVCDRCGRLDDLVAGRPAGGIRAARDAGHEVTGHLLVVHGRCRSCRRGAAG